MRIVSLATLKFLALLFLIPGSAGLILSAVTSTDYLDNLPRFPVPQERRMVPRNINGTVVYQTSDEDQKLTLLEDASAGIFLMGIGVGLVYLEKWSHLRSRASEEEEEGIEDPGRQGFRPMEEERHRG